MSPTFPYILLELAITRNELPSEMTKVRHANSSDVDRIYDLILAIADHDGQSKYVKTNPSELLASGFGDSPNYGILLAEHNGSIVGFASFTINYSIWLGQKYMNIDDVYVDSNSRGLGIGEKLMQESKSHCDRIGISRIRWEVQTDNHNAIRFYERLGAQMIEKGVFTWDVSR